MQSVLRGSQSAVLLGGSYIHFGVNFCLLRGWVISLTSITGTETHQDDSILIHPAGKQVKSQDLLWTRSFNFLFSF